MHFFSGARDLARYVAGSDEAHTAFVEKLFQYTIKQPIRAYGPDALPDLKHATPHSDDTAKKLQNALVDAFNTTL